MLLSSTVPVYVARPVPEKVLSTEDVQELIVQRIRKLAHLQFVTGGYYDYIEKNKTHFPLLAESKRNLTIEECYQEAARFAVTPKPKLPNIPLMDVPT